MTKYTTWTYNPSTQELVHQNPTHNVDIEDMTNSAKCLDWIFQVYKKPWATADDIDGPLEAIQELVEPQKNLCPWGRERGTN